MEVIVEERGRKVVRGANGVHVAGEVQVELFHRNHLAVAAARGAALNAKDRPKARLPNGDSGAVTNLVESLRETNGGGGLPLTERCWANRSDYNVLAACAALL